MGGGGGGGEWVTLGGGGSTGRSIKAEHEGRTKGTRGVEVA